MSRRDDFDEPTTRSTVLIPAAIWRPIGIEDLEPSAWEPLAQFASRILEPRTVTTAIRPGADMNIWQEIQDWLETRSEQDGLLAWLERNYVLSGYPELWRRYKWPEAAERFRADLMLFNIVETGA